MSKRFRYSLSNCAFPIFCGTIIIITSPLHPQANELGVNLYGLSYHLLNDGQSREYLNEFNAGIGLRATFGRRTTSQLFFEGGSYKDTFENQAKYLSVGVLLKMIAQLRVGINAAVYSSESIQNGNAFFAPVPIAAYTLGPVTFNGVYLPKYGGINAYNTLGFYATVRIFEGTAAKK